MKESLPPFPSNLSELRRGSTFLHPLPLAFRGENSAFPLSSVAMHTYNIAWALPSQRRHLVQSQLLAALRLR